MKTPAVTVVGAGPAGLAAAIVLARAGRDVTLNEWHGDVGHRFHGDHQGIENWSDERDLLDELAAAGIEPRFDHVPMSSGTVLDTRGWAHVVRSERPLFYLVRRGNASDTLDAALLDQARAAGVKVAFNSRVERVSGPTVLATGPRRADVIAHGILFETDHADGAWLALGERVAPGGYAYLLIAGGRATLAVCMFRDFDRRGACLDNARDLFLSRSGVKVRHARPFGGYGAWWLGRRFTVAGQPLAGERAGLQDPLGGFGIRMALRSGIAAARQLVEGGDYDATCRAAFLPQVARGALNRRIFDHAPGWLLDRSAASLARGDARVPLRRLYRPGLATRLASPVATLLSRDPLAGLACQEAGCGCNWCKCARDQRMERAHA